MSIASIAANTIDFIYEEFVMTRASETSAKSACTNQAGLRGMLYAAYGLMGIVVLYAHDLALVQWRQGWSFLTFAYFLGSAFEFMGMVCLAVKVHSSKSVAGISAKSLGLFALSLLARAAATGFHSGYLPVDKSGDYMAQALDLSSALVAMYLLYAAQKKYIHTYQDETDTMPIGPIVTSCAIAAFFIHGELNQNFFDQLWAFSLNIEVFQLVPQLYMLAKVGGTIDSATAHFVGNVFMSCLGRFLFWIWAIPGCKDLVAEENMFDTSAEDFKIGGLYILAAYALQTLISLDFVYYYVKAWLNGTKVFLPAVGGEEI